MRTSFNFEEIANFDARRGLSRCTEPGVGMRGYNQTGNADFWRNADGDLLVRFESSGYRYSFCARTSSGATVADDQLNDFMAHVSEMLLTWLCNGVDDAPET